MVATEAEFVQAAVEIARVADKVEDSGRTVRHDRDSIPILGGTIRNIVELQYDEVDGMTKSVVNFLENLSAQLQDRARQCAAYSEAVRQYEFDKRMWWLKDPATRGPAPVRPEPTAPWMEAS